MQDGERSRATVCIDMNAVGQYLGWQQMVTDAVDAQAYCGPVLSHLLFVTAIEELFDSVCGAIGLYASICNCNIIPTQT